MDARPEHETGPTAVGTASELLTATPRSVHPRATRFPTGFAPLDDVLRGGIRAQDLVLLGGRPGIGKTDLALQWARWMAMQGQTAIFVCYEHAPQALLGRLLALELGSLVRRDETSALTRLRPLAEEVALGAAPASALTTDPLGEEAYHRVQQYGPRLHLVQGSGLCTGTVELARVVAEHGAGATALFVDYLQKVPVPGDGRSVEERSTHLVERLKELAMVTGVAVVAIAATDKVGLRTRRVRLHHLRGSAALAHEADVAILVNEKAVAVSKAHLAYDPVRAEHFKRFVVLSVEKNRDGTPDIDLEFRKDLANHRFDPEGGFVAESLVDALLVEE